MKKANLGKTSTGIQAEVSALLCYILGFITGVIFYVIEKDNKFVRFHAMQSIIVFGGLFVIGIGLSIITWMFIVIRLYFFMPLFNFISAVLWLAGIILWFILMIKAYQGEYFKLPVIGNIAEKQSQASSSM